MAKSGMSSMFPKDEVERRGDASAQNEAVISIIDSLLGHRRCARDRSTDCWVSDATKDSRLIAGYNSGSPAAAGREQEGAIQAEHWCRSFPGVGSRVLGMRCRPTKLCRALKRPIACRTLELKAEVVPQKTYIPIWLSPRLVRGTSVSTIRLLEFGTYPRPKPTERTDSGIA